MKWIYEGKKPIICIVWIGIACWSSDQYQIRSLKRIQQERLFCLASIWPTKLKSKSTVKPGLTHISRTKWIKTACSQIYNGTFFVSLMLKAAVDLESRHLSIPCFSPNCTIRKTFRARTNARRKRSMWTQPRWCCRKKVSTCVWQLSTRRASARALTTRTVRRRLSTTLISNTKNIWTRSHVCHASPSSTTAYIAACISLRLVTRKSCLHARSFLSCTVFLFRLLYTWIEIDSASSTLT